MARLAAPPSFYDQAPASEKLYAQYDELWRHAAALVPRGASVVELGCGTGRLAKLIVPNVRSYLGLDFSVRCITEARQNVPGADFRVSDVRDPIPPAEVYVATEVLEHLDDDLGLLAQLPSWSTVVLSVPSFDSHSHVRWFPNRGDARKRYRDALAIDHEEFIKHGTKGRFFHLLRGTRP